MPISVYRAGRVPSPAEVEWLLAGITSFLTVAIIHRPTGDRKVNVLGRLGVHTRPGQVWPLPKIARRAAEREGERQIVYARGTRVERVSSVSSWQAARQLRRFRVPWNRRKRLRGARAGDRSPRRSQTGVSDSCPRRRLPTYCSPPAGAALEMTSEADAPLPPPGEGWFRHLLESRRSARHADKNDIARTPPSGFISRSAR